MAVRRKVFRIEQMGPVGTPMRVLESTDISPAHRDEILAELKALRDLVERRDPVAPTTEKSGTLDARDLARLRSETDAIAFALNRTRQEIAALHVGGHEPTQVSRELDAVAEGAGRATELILSAAEAIEEAANNLSASLKHAQDAALALDIQDNVLRIFEACNFQDLGGQRIAKVLATMKFVEERVACMVEIWGGIDGLRPPATAAIAERDSGTTLHGPCLPGDEGHATQDDVDLMFATG